MGGSNNTTVSTTAQKVGNVRIQSSSYGLTLPLGYGRNRVPGNLTWYDGFAAIPHTTTTETESGGKGGGSSTTTTSSTTYTYEADATMALVQGPVISIQSMWRMKDRFLGTALGSSQTVTENLTIPSNRKVRLSFYSFATSVASVILVQSNSGTSNTTLASPADYSVAGGIITIVNAAYAGRVVRVTYNYTPGGDTATAGSSEGMTLFQGSWGQGSWSHFSTNYPDKDIPYSNVAYVAAAGYQLNDDASFANHNFEINFKLQYPGKADANPADIITDILTNPDSGSQFPGDKLADLTSYSDYCRASGIFLSPVYIEQQEARAMITQLCAMTNSAPVWSEGLLKIIPYGDTAMTANGVTYTPNLTPVYDLTDDDFLVSGNEDPVSVERDTPADAFNQVQIEFLNRANAYNAEIAERKDQANIEQFGLRAAQPETMHSVCDPSVAVTVCQIKLQRGLYVRNKYRFRLGWKFCLLEPMDLVTLTDSKLGFTNYVVRVIDIAEDENGKLSVVCEDFPQGVAHATLYPTPTAAGYQSANNALPGNVTVPFFFESPITDTTIDNEVWCAVSGADVNWGGCNIWYSMDGVTYKKWGKHFGSRYGTLTNNMAAGIAATASVKLIGRGGQMLNATAAEAAAGATRCRVGNEYFTYESATLTAINAYILGTLRRGLDGTLDYPHVAGENFVRVDSAIAKIGPFDLKLVGQLFYFKFTSFNVYGAREQSLASVSAYTYSVTRDVSSDDMLKPPEKPVVIKEYADVQFEVTDLDLQAIALSITTEKTAFDNAAAQLNAYMATLTTPVMWNNVNGNTNLP